MSVSYYANVLFGGRFDQDALHHSVLNPEYNHTAPFCSKTGKKIPQFIITKYHFEEEVDKYGLEVFNTYFGGVFVGKLLSGDSMDLEYNGNTGFELKQLTPEEIVEVTNKLKKFCDDFGLEFIEPRTWLVGRSGY